MVGAADRLAVQHGLEHAQDAALRVGVDQEGAELVAQPEAAIGRDLQALGVEVGAGQVARRARVGHDMKGDDPVGVGEEDGAFDGDRAGGEVRPHAVDHQQRVGAVAAVAEAVIAGDPVAAVGRLIAGSAGGRPDAREPLHRLAGEGQRQPGFAVAVGGADIAHNTAALLIADVARAGEAAGGREARRCVGRRGHEGCGRQHRVAGHPGLEALVGLGRRGEGQRGEGQQAGGQ